MLMQGYITLGILLGLPIFFGLFFRVSAPHIFFAVMTGELLGRYFGEDVEHFMAETFKNEQLTHYAEALIITIPVILTALFLKRTLSKTKSLLNIFPLIITGVVYAAFMLPILPSELQAQVQTVPFGKDLFDTSSAIIGGVVLVQLVALWLLNRGEADKRSKKRRKKD